MVGLSGLEPPTSRLSGVRSNQLSYRPIFLERVKGIEPSSSAWKAEVLPLNYTRIYMGRLMGIEPTNVGTTIRCVNHFATIAVIFYIKWWLRTESNRRHKDFQSFALPTELLSRKNGGPDGNRTRDLLRDRQAC